MENENNKKYLSLKQLEQTISINDFTTDWCSDNGLDFTELCEKYNGSQRNLERYAANHNLKRSQVFINNKRTQNNIKKYGVETPSKLESVKNKAKQTCLEKYGVENGGWTKESQEKIKKTTFEHFGVYYPTQSSEIREKIKNTKLAKYGDSNYRNSDQIRETNLKKYGYENPFANEDVKDKIKQTCLEKYGVEYSCQLDNCRNKSNGCHSKPNDDFAKLLEDNHISFKREFSLKNKIFDFIIDDTLIEIDPAVTHNSNWGIHNTTGIDKNYHKEKTNLAIENGYKCIHVWDWDDMSKVINLVIPKQKIYARKCEIREIPDDSIFREFINKNHIQGYCKNQKIILGLYYEDKLVEIMSFGKPRYNKNYEYELLRLCTDYKYIVIGGAEKLFSYFLKNYNPQSIISYCDKSKFSGKIYQKLRFLQQSNTIEPSCHWYNIRTKKHITDNLLRQKGFDGLFHTSYGKGSSNEELMLKNKFVQIYDCGQYTFIWKSIKREE